MTPGYRTKDVSLMPVSVKVGDKVLSPEYGGVPLKNWFWQITLFRNSSSLDSVV